MRKLISTLNLLLIMIALTACGGGGGGDDDSSSGNTQAPAPAPTPCQLEQCTTLDNAQKVTINADLQVGDFLGGETYAVKFDGIIGNEYKIHVNSNVGYSVYITDSNPLIPSQALFRDREPFSGHNRSSSFDIWQNSNRQI